MLAEVISIGDELTSGQRLDTNTQWLSERLGELGVRVMYHTTVADDLPANVHVFRQACQRADMIVATGGLGPTADDLTRDALAEAVGCPLVHDAAAMAHIEALFARRKRPMPERNRVQAQFPAGARVIHNANGTAPGIDLDVPRPLRAPARVFCLPGVPAEMREMWEQTVGPAVAKMSGGGRFILHHEVKCFGVGESDLEALLPDIIRRGRDPQVGITVHQATITLRISATGNTREECAAKIAATLATIHACLGVLVYGENQCEIHEAVMQLLEARQATLATVEFGTSGLLANWLGETAGSERTYVGGRVLRAAAQPLAELAAATRDELGATYVLATGPFPLPPGEFEMGLLGPEGWAWKTAPFSGHPDILRERSGKQALNWLRLHLLRHV